MEAKQENQLKAIVARCAERHGDDLNATVKAAGQALRRLDDEAINALLWEMGVQEAVYRYRCGVNAEIRAACRPGDPKVCAGGSATAARVGRAIEEYNYFIAGQRLGDVLGEQLPAIADGEAALADGHLFNARLCRKLRPLVKDGTRVQDAVRPKKLKEIFVELQAA